MDWSDIVLRIIELLLPVLVALLVALIGYGISYLKMKTAEVNNKIVRDSLHAALEEAEVVAINAVRATNQVLVDELKANNEDGKLTKEEVLKALQTAKQYFLTTISADSLEILEASLGPVQEWLEQLIEAKVAETKIEKQILSLANPT